MYDPFATPPAPGMMQTMAAPQQPPMMPPQAMPNALAGMGRFPGQARGMLGWRPGMPFPPGVMPQQGAPGAGPPQGFQDWRTALGDFRQQRMDWREDRPQFERGMQRPAFHQQMMDWRGDRPRWGGWGG